MLARIEPDIVLIDSAAAWASIAISLKRIADALNEPNDHGEVGSAALAGAIYRGLKNQ
jgi:hypothetical protein